MKVSVVICGYDPALETDLVDAAESVLEQTYEPVELVIVIDGTDSLYEALKARFGTNPDVVLHLNNENMGLSRSRNIGIDLATGDVVAFMDDDAVAHPDWLEELLSTYGRHDALAVGGRMAPRWMADRPKYLPKEFYWLIGVTYRGYPERECEIRNTFGSNISFLASVLDDLGGFKHELGIIGVRQLQGEETELAARMRDEFGEGVWYNPDAVVEHKIFKRRTELDWLLKRAFWQGYSKRIMASLFPGKTNASNTETEFLEQLIVVAVPRLLDDTIRNQSHQSLGQLLTLIILTMAVGLGYGYAAIDKTLSATIHP